MKAPVAAALGLLALVAVMLVVQDDGGAIRAELSWKDLGVPEDIPAKDDEHQFVQDMEAVIQDENDEDTASECMIKKADGNQYEAEGKACCEHRFSKDVGDCNKAMKGCATDRMSKTRSNFNVCATAAQRDCDDEQEAFKSGHTRPEETPASKKKQLKSMAAASSNPSELMFAAFTALTTQKGSSDEAVKEEVDPKKIEVTSEAKAPVKEVPSAAKPVNLITVHRRCIAKRMAECHSKVTGAKARHLAACKAQHGARAASCRYSAKDTRDKCIAADATAAYFSED